MWVFLPFLPFLPWKQALPRAGSLIAVNSRSAVEGRGSMLTYISGCRERVSPGKLSFQHQGCDPVVPPRRRPCRGAGLAPRAEVPAAAGAHEAAPAAFVGLCQGVFTAGKVSVSHIAGDALTVTSGKKKEEKRSSMEKQQIKSKGKVSRWRSCLESSCWWNLVL